MPADPTVRIAWNQGTMGEWGAAFARAPRSTLPQSFAYAQAMAKTYGYVPRLGLIERGGTPIGLVQVLERRLLKLFHDRQIHRGPLWFDGVPEADVLEAVLRQLRKACPRNPLNRLSFLPELPAGAEMEELMLRCGFRRIGPGYRTVWIDLARSEEEILAGFNTLWRRGARAVEKAKLRIDVDAEAENLPWLMVQEHEQAQSKQFRAMTDALALRLRAALRPSGGAFMVAALDGRTPVASALFLRHGAAATYQVGWSSEQGRKANAMRAVQWHAMRLLKERGVRWFDIGGINPESAPGVTEFKLGTGGEATETVGLFR